LICVVGGGVGVEHVTTLDAEIVTNLSSTGS